MVPSRALFEAMIDAMAADTAFLAAATAMHVHPVVNNFVPSQTISLGSLTLATFTGGAAKNCGVGAQTVFLDPIANLLLIQLLEPAGGFTWECTVTPASPETVYGYAVTDTADAVLLGTALLDTPVAISVAGQGFSVPYIRLRFLNTSPF